jgi:YD repeat-containing protein
LPAAGHDERMRDGRSLRGNNELTNNNGTHLSQSQLGISATTPPTGSPTYYTYTPEGTLIDERTPTGTYYYGMDALGSITRLTNSSGQQVQAYAYDPYGNVNCDAGDRGSPESIFLPRRIPGYGTRKGSSTVRWPLLRHHDG